MKYFKLVLGFLFAFLLGYFIESCSLLNPKKQKLKELERFLDQHYIDTLNKDSLIDLSIVFLMDKLDPFSSYISSEEKDKRIDYTNKYYEGVGLEINSVNDSLVVTEVLKRAKNNKHIEVGDRIIALGEDTLIGENAFVDTYQEKISKHLEQQINAFIYRPKDSSCLNLKLEKQKIETNNIEVTTLINPDLAYIKLKLFGANALKNMAVVINEIEKQGANNLILDLRDNPGGDLTAAIQLADAFLSEGQKIIEISKKDSHKIFYANEKQWFQKGQVYILVNGFTASSSEILSSALQENDRATIIGRQTYGKGYIQEERKLSDGSIMRLTISEYYTVLGRKVQKYLPVQDSISNLKEVNQKLLEEVPTFKTAKGKIIYQTGGIFPDIFVKYNDFKLPEFFLHRNGLQTLKIFAYHEVDQKRGYYQCLELQEYLHHFEIEELYKKWEREHRFYSLNSKQAKIAQQYLKAYIGFYAYEDKAIFYQQKALVDSDILKVKELICDSENLSD